MGKIAELCFLTRNGKGALGRRTDWQPEGREASRRKDSLRRAVKTEVGR